MKRHVAAITILLMLACAGFAAQSFRVEAAHFDVRGGPLTVSAEDGSPLPDGCVGQIIEDTGGDGLAPPCRDGTPGESDRLLVFTSKEMKNSSGSFLVNGSQRIGAQGFFLSPDFTGSHAPVQSVFLRVWNSPDPRSASGYWDSPPLRLTSGPQQISFPRSAWEFHPFDPSDGAGSDDKNLSSERTSAEARSPELLQAYPNPFNSTARIAFTLSRGARVELALFDVQGRRVKSLLDAPLPAGPHDVALDGRALPSGLYFISLQTSHGPSVVRRVLLVR